MLWFLITLNKISPTIESIREISNIYIDKGEIEKPRKRFKIFLNQINHIQNSIKASGM